MVTSKCEEEQDCLSQPHQKERKKGEKRRKGRARGSMSETEKQVGRQKESLENQIFFFASK